jgi:hypothetical protein
VVWAALAEIWRRRQQGMVRRPECALMVLLWPAFAGGLPSIIKEEICEHMYEGIVRFTTCGLVHTVTW